MSTLLLLCFSSCSSFSHLLCFQPSWFQCPRNLCQPYCQSLDRRVRRNKPWGTGSLRKPGGFCPGPTPCWKLQLLGNPAGQSGGLYTELKLLLEVLVQETVQQALLQDVTRWQNLLRYHARKSRRDNPERRRFKSLRVNVIVSTVLSVQDIIIFSNQSPDLK